MSDLQKLRESVLAKAHKEGQALLEQARQEHECEYQEKLQQVNRERESLRQLQLSKETQRLSRLEQQIANQERQENLKCRQVLIDQLFDGAISKMMQWSSVEFLSFTKNILHQFVNKDIQLTFGEHSKMTLTSEQLTEISNEFPNLTITDAVVKEASGFVLKEGRVDYNFLFDQLVLSMRDEMSADLAQQVFSAN